MGEPLGEGLVTLPRVPDVVELAVGPYMVCVRQRAGAVWCGDGRANVPLQRRDDVEHAVQVSVGVLHACARLDGGAVRCWGLNHYGQLGDGTRETRDGAVTVEGLP